MGIKSKPIVPTTAHHNYQWMNANEVNFIRNVGKWRESGKYARNDTFEQRHVRCVRGYLASLKWRWNWGDVEKRRVVAVAIGEIIK